MASTVNPKELDITEDEMERIQKALKDEEFRKLFIEYAQEISDPENRKKYEAEIAELERNRGMDVKFVNPEPGYVLKTSVNGDTKCFINICINQNIGKPDSKMTTRGNGALLKSGLQWSVPYSLSPPREDVDHASKKCVVYDCVFHPDCLKIVDIDKRFKKVMEDTALDGIEREFKVELDRHNIKKPKMKFKGIPKATVIRTPNNKGPTGSEDGISALGLSYPYDNPGKDVNGNHHEDLANGTSKYVNGSSDIEVSPTAPKYSIIHRGNFDLQNYTNAPDSMPSTRPQELVVKIELPLVKSASSIQLDVFTKRIVLECKKPVCYLLDVALPFEVIEDKGSAKFDKSKSCMILTLPVLPPEIPKLPTFISDRQEQTKQLISDITQENSNNCQNQIFNSHPETNSAEKEKKVSLDSGKLAAERIQEVNSSKGKSDLCSDVLKHDTATESDQECLANTFLLNETPSPFDVHQTSFTYSQNTRTLTILIKEKGISSFTPLIHGDGQRVSLEFMIVKNEKKIEFGLHLTFAEGCAVEGDTETSVTEENCVVVLTKREECVGDWQFFYVDINGVQKQYFFVTRQNLEGRSEKLEAESQSEGERSCSTGHVESSSRKIEAGKVTFTITPEAPFPDSNQRPSLMSTSSEEVSLRNEELHVEVNSSSPKESSSFSPSGLKSSLRSPRQRCSKSVSFSENVMVETFLDKVGKKGRRKTPYIRRSVEKLKDNSWYEVCSDSELFLHRMYDEDHELEEDVWNIVPKRKVVSRQSSSESESDLPNSPKGKGRKSKGSRRRRKEKAKKALLQDSLEEDKHLEDKTLAAQAEKKVVPETGNTAEANGEENKEDCVEDEVFLESTNKNEENGKEEELEDDAEEGWIEVSTKGKGRERRNSGSTLEKNTADKGKEEVKGLLNGDLNGKEDPSISKDKKVKFNDEVLGVNDDSDVPLELQNHHTESSVVLSNKVMFQLDDDI